MPLSLSLEELLRYTGGERDRWRGYLLAHPEALDAFVQPGARFPTVGKLVDHIFLVERRHLQRLMDAPLSDRTGLTGNNAPPLFDYGASVRRELEQYIGELDDEVADLHGGRRHGVERRRNAILGRRCAELLALKGRNKPLQGWRGLTTVPGVARTLHPRLFYGVPLGRKSEHYFLKSYRSGSCT